MCSLALIKIKQSFSVSLRSPRTWNRTWKMIGNGSQSLLDMCLFLFLWETTEFWLCDKPLEKKKKKNLSLHVFSGGQLKAPETLSAVSTLDHGSAGGRQGFPHTCNPALWTSAVLRTASLLCPERSCLGMMADGKGCSLTQSSQGESARWEMEHGTVRQGDWK